MVYIAVYCDSYLFPYIVIVFGDSIKKTSYSTIIVNKLK